MSGPLDGRELILGVTGSIAAYKAVYLLRELARGGARVTVCLSEHAREFVGPLTFRTLSGRPVLTSLFDPQSEAAVEHVALAEQAAAVVVAPATANLLAKAAHGIADDFLTTLLLAVRCPVVMAPAMDGGMWTHPAVTANVAALRARGVTVLEPDAGALASGLSARGRLPEVDAIVEAVLGALTARRDLVGERVVVTAGPTEEPIDPVRVITNTSSGKMGYAVARAAREAGARVILVSGPTALAVPVGVECVRVRSAEQMFDAVKKAVPGSDVFFSVAAVSDYRAKQRAAQKIKKGGTGLGLELIENPDILAWVAEQKDAPFCVGFAAESEKLAEHARAKRAKKAVPLLAANMAQQALGADDNDITLFDERGEHPLGRAPKLELARRLVAHVAGMLAGEKRARAKA
jgi:phosphopantothenoylcysteine decarboxylase/phosphopantothenate--cysteine ligase